MAQTMSFMIYSYWLIRLFGGRVHDRGEVENVSKCPAITMGKRNTLHKSRPNYSSLDRSLRQSWCTCSKWRREKKNILKKTVSVKPRDYKLYTTRHCARAASGVLVRLEQRSQTDGDRWRNKLFGRNDTAFDVWRRQAVTSIKLLPSAAFRIAPLQPSSELFLSPATEHRRNAMELTAWRFGTTGRLGSVLSSIEITSS